MAEQAQILAQLAELRERYGKELPDRINQIRGTLDELRNRWNPETLVTLHRYAHSLTGSGATFGYVAVSQSARELEQALKVHIESQPDQPPKQWREWEAALVALESAVHVVSMPADLETVPALSPKAQVEQRLIFLVEDDVDLTREQRLHYELHGYVVREFYAIEGLEQALRDQPPLAMVVDVIFPEGDMEGIRAVGELKDKMGTLPPVIFASRREDLHARLEAVRAGAAAYFIKPLDLPLVIETLDRLTAPHDPVPYRILIVDDDETLAFHMALLLQRAGMETRVLSEPEQILKLMADFQPELVLMDLYLPGCTGIELAAVIRQEVSYVGTQILFLSVETDIDKHLEAMRVGGDDFLIKPLPPAHLLATVEARVRRARAITSVMVRDSLTGLLNHTAIEEQLKRELGLHSRHDDTISYVMIDLDHFKKVNDRYGHAMGDRVLRSLSRLLRQRLRQTDLIGRYGGEEFVVVLPGTDAELAAKMINELRTAFASLIFDAAGQRFSVTFSAGVASAPPIEDATGLHQQADIALYQAKAAGRNQVIIAEYSM